MEFDHNMTTGHTCLCRHGPQHQSMTTRLSPDRTQNRYCSYLRNTIRKLSPYHQHLHRHCHHPSSSSSRTSSLTLSQSFKTGLCIMVLLSSLTTVTMATGSVQNVPKTPRFTPKDIIPFRGRANNTDVQYYRYMTLDTETDTLLVGAMNFIFQLHLSDISRNPKMSQNITNQEVEKNSVRCLRLQKSWDFECQNHIRAIIRTTDGTLDVCGTAAYYPMKFTFNIRDITAPFRDGNVSESGRSFCSRDPQDTCTAIYIRDGNPGNYGAIYSGAIRDIPKSDPVIFRPELSPGMKVLRTKRQDKWLYKPDFVASFEVGQYVFFFLRETAVEHANCQDVVYSRVARICKKDLGGNYRVLNYRWTTYFKARLNCSLPGEYPFYFNEIHDVIKTSDGTFHGLFTTSKNSMHGSALCTFTLDAIDEAFKGPFLEQMTENSIWTKVVESQVPNPRPGQCVDDSDLLPDSTLRFAENRPLMANAVASQPGAPLFYQQEVTFRKFALYQTGDYTVYFLAEKDDFTIHKVVSWVDRTTKEPKSKTLAIWENVTSGELVRQMILHDKTLYISTDKDVFQMNIDHCKNYTYCTQCMQDPLCGWDTHWDICTHRINDPGVQTDVETNNPVLSCNDACKRNKIPHEHYIHVQGDAIHLNCSSHCEPSDDILWYHDNDLVNIDHKKYFLTRDNSLIVFNVSDSDRGMYKCRSETVELANHRLSVNECNDAESCWRQEFVHWCNEFEKYQQELKHWQCLKRQCTQSEQCVPTGIADQCHAP